MIIAILTLAAIAKSPDIVMHYSEYDGHDNFWVKPPEVVICKSQSRFNKEQVSHVVNNVWREKIDKITVRSSCNYEPEYGVIKILDGKYLHPQEIGRANLIYADVFRKGKHVEMYKASVVQLDIQVNDITLLIHELGHAFGFNHYDKAHDVMNVR